MPERTHPAVTVIIPARNEERYIEACVRSCLAQHVEGGVEVVVADGRSHDRTRELAERSGARVIDNEAQTIPAGLNKALDAAAGTFVIRFDAHALMPPGYIDACLAALKAPQVVNAGGWRKVESSGPWGRAVAGALASRAGVGNRRIWVQPEPAQAPLSVDTVPLGAWRSETLRAAAGWDEELLANEDFELNHRLRERGGTILFDPRIWSIYRPRESAGAVASQYWRYGWWKAAMLARNPASIKPRQLAPVALLTVVVGSFFSRDARLALVVYGAGLVVVTVRARSGWRVAPTLATMHLAWGAGFVAGLFRVGRRSRALSAKSRASATG